MIKLIFAAFLSMAWLGEAGNGNIVIGNGNMVRGNNNFAQGNQNLQDGDRTKIIGSNNFNQGNDREIIGDNQYVSSQHPEYKTYRDPTENYRRQNPNHASFDLSGTVGETLPLGPHLTSQPFRVQPNYQQSQTGYQVNGRAQVLNSMTQEFLEQKRREIMEQLQRHFKGIRNSQTNGHFLP